MDETITVDVKFDPHETLPQLLSNTVLGRHFCSEAISVRQVVSRTIWKEFRAIQDMKEVAPSVPVTQAMPAFQ